MSLFMIFASFAIYIAIRELFLKGGGDGDSK